MTNKIDKTAAPESEKTPSRFRRFWGRKRILALAVLTGCFIAASWFVPISALWTAERERASSVRLLEEFLPQAILDGDGETALELAQKIDERPFPYLGRLNVKILCRGVAFELNGDYEKSLEAYRLAANRNNVDAKNDAEPTGVDSFLGRVYYRLDRRADAFAAYCRLAESARKRAAETSENSRIDEAQATFWTLESAKRRVLFAFGEDKRSPLDPFADYDEFLNFVESEFERAAEPEKFEPAVQFWRDAATVELTPERRPETAFALEDGEYFFEVDSTARNPEFSKEERGMRVLTGDQN